MAFILTITDISVLTVGETFQKGIPMPNPLYKENYAKKVMAWLTKEQIAFFNAHPRLLMSEAIRQGLDKFIETFDEAEYQKMAGE